MMIDRIGCAVDKGVWNEELVVADENYPDCKGRNHANHTEYLDDLFVEVGNLVVRKNITVSSLI